MKYLTLLLASCLWLHNCSNNPAKEASADASAVQSVEPSNSTASTDSIICVSGLLQCNDSMAVLIETAGDSAVRQYQLIDKTRTLFSLHNKATEPAHHMVEMSRAVVCGKVIFANKQSKLLTMDVNRVESVVAKTVENFGLAYEFWCEGSDPNDWRVEISNYIGFIYYENAGDPSGWLYPWYPPTVSGNKWTYNIPATRGYNGALSLVIKKEKYTNPKTLKAYDYSCELKANGKTLKGGALRGTANVMGAY